MPSLLFEPDRHEALSGTLNSIHNLAYYLGVMERVRKSLQGKGSELAS